jgi:hypothetical protein
MEKKKILVRTENKRRRVNNVLFLTIGNNVSTSKRKMSDLEHLATELSGCNTTILIILTPKYHCKLAGEGMEYCWGAAN